MGINRLAVLILVILSAYAVASPAASTECHSTGTAPFESFQFEVQSSTGVMSSQGPFTAIASNGIEWSGYLFEQPTMDSKRAYQGRAENASGSPTEFFIWVDGQASALFFRDITVMGPTSWQRQDLSCVY